MAEISANATLYWKFWAMLLYIIIHRKLPTEVAKIIGYLEEDVFLSRILGGEISTYMRNTTRENFKIASLMGQKCGIGYRRTS